MSTVTAVDAATFRALQDTAGAEFVGDLLGTFREEAPRMLSALRSAFAAGDAEGFRRTAHSLKSNALTFGATELASLARALELSGLEAARAQGGDPVGALAAAYARAAEALEALARA
jgi:HPt (histidine-containing phosphotransfer) domain-containing protein